MGMFREYGTDMDRTHRPDEPDKPVTTPDGPLTRLIDEEVNPPEPPHGSRRPQPPEPKRQGQDDYASGTPEHDDDREE